MGGSQGYQALAAALMDNGVSTLFGLLGDGNMYFANSYVHERGGRYVAAANEAGSVLMASGYASATGDIGVATVTHGPGLTNTITALVSAVRARTPMVLVTGDTPRAARRHAQNIDHAALTLPTGAGFEQVGSASDIAAAMGRACARARAERRPVVLNVPVEFDFVDAPPAAAQRRPLPPARIAADAASMDAAVGAMASARRPIVLAGRGALVGRTPELLIELADVLGAPLATTLATKGMFGTIGHDLGVFGSFSSNAATDAILAADCIVAVGASLNQYTGGGDGWPYLSGRRVIHCDREPAAFAAEYAADIPVLSDGETFALTALEWLREAGVTPTGFRSSITFARDPVDDAYAICGGVSLSAALEELNRVLPRERSVSVDGGRFIYEAVKRMDVADSRGWTCPVQGLSAVGHAVSFAVGVGCAIPEAPSVAIVGDGSFMLGGLVEFNTAVRHGVDLITFVCNDGAYGVEHGKLLSHEMDPGISMFEWPDFGPVAEALGGRGHTIRTPDDLAALGDVIAERDRPLLVDLKLDPATSSKQY